MSQLKDIFGITAVPYLGKRIWRAHGYIDVYHDNSLISFMGHYATDTESRTEFWQPHILKAAWSNNPDVAIVKVKKKLCKVRAKEDAFYEKDDKRGDEKKFVEWKPDVECPI